MSEAIKKIDDLLNKYYDALETGNKKKQEKIYNEYLELKKQVKANLGSLSKSDRKTYKIVSSEFRILSSEEERNKLFEGINKSQSQSKKLQTNDEYLNEAKNITSNTTKALKQSLQQLEEAKEIGNGALITIKIDGDKINNINNKMDEIQSDSKIAMKLITRSFKRLYTDKLIMLFIFIVVSLIIIILLFKYKIIQI